MKYTIRKYSFALILILFVYPSSPSGAALISGVQFDQLLFVADRQTGNRTYSPSFAGNSPASDTRSVSAPDLGLIQATYQFSNTDSKAVFDINVNWTATNWGLVSAQSPDGNTRPVQFMITQPVFYSIAVSQFTSESTNIPTATTIARLDGAPSIGNVFNYRLEKNGPSPHISGGLPGSGLPYTFTDPDILGQGMLLPSQSPYSFITLVDGAVPNGSGTLSGFGGIALTLTPAISPVPLPGSFLLMLTGLATVGIIHYVARCFNLIGSNAS